MDQIKELEKYKALLDEGAISEDEFRKLKQKLLGLKTDEEKEVEKQQERAEALAEIEKMRAEENAKKEEAERAEREKQQQEQLEEERRKQELKAKEEQENYQKTFEAEKAKEQARLEALHEQEQKKKQEQLEKAQKTAKVATSVAGKVVLWIVTVFCALVGIFSFIPSESTNRSFDVVSAIFFLIYAALACPPLSAKLKENEMLAQNWKYKKFIVIGLVILWFVFAAVLSK